MLPDYMKRVHCRHVTYTFIDKVAGTDAGVSESLLEEMMTRKLLWGLTILLSSAMCICSYAQNTNGTILGTVMDPTNAVVENAKITAINTGTQARTSAASGSDGSFALHVPPGSYDVTVEAPGFQTFKTSAVQVLVNEDSRVAAVLHPGAAVQVVTVNSINTHIDTTSATLKNVVGEQTIQSMPLNGRNPISLVLLVPGVTRDPNASVTSGATYPSIGGISINGTRSNSTNYILDGASDNDNYTNAPNPYPDPDALQEFSVQTNNFSAEFGRLAGGVVNVVTKSGTNQIHGSAFEYIRNNYFNAANHFSAVTNGHKSDDGLKRNQFGGTFGGPLVLPRIYNGKDRSFFFASYQGTIVHQRPNAQSAVVPDTNLRNGNFSELSTPLYVPYDPNRSTFQGNQIPEIDPVAQYMLQFIPTAPAGTPVNSQGGQQIFYTGLSNSLDNQVNVRVDHRITAKNTIFGTFFNSQDSSPGLLDLKNILSNVAPVRRLSRRALVSDTHVFSPHLLNQVLFSYSHDHYWETPITPPKPLTDLGVNASVTPIAGQYKFAVSSYFSISTADTNQFFRDEYQAIDTVRYSHGNHQIALGGEYSRGTAGNINNFQQNPIYTFTGSKPPANSVATSTGNSFADFLLGRFSAFKQGAGEYKNTRFNHIAAFAEDTWRVNSKLVLDLGARYEPFFPYTDTHNRLAAWRPGQQSTVYPNAPVGVVFPGDKGIPSGAFNRSWGNFGPRVGFAYNVAGKGKTTIHGGYGIFYDLPNTITTNNMTDQAPFAPVITLSGTSQNNVENPYGGTTNPFPYPTFPASPVQPTKDATFPVLTNQYLYSANMRNGYVESWNLQVQQEVGWATVFSVAYAGSMGVHLPVVRELNPAIYTPGSSTLSNTNQRRALAPALGSTSLLAPIAHSNYHALLLNVERHFQNNFSMMANYSFSKAMDISSQPKETGQTITNPFDPHFDYGPADYDRRHVVNASTVWLIPGPRGNRLMREVLGGWEHTMIFNYTGGYPFSVLSGQDNAFSGTANQRADSVPGQAVEVSGHPANASRAVEWMNKQAFAVNAIGTYGDTGRNAYRGPGYTDFDMGLMKRFQLKERLNTTFRFETFNIFNHTNLGKPANNISSGNFGLITSADDPRILQFALRLNW